MTPIRRALCWALAIILVALGNRFALVDDASAQTLFVVLPIVALMALKGGTACRIGQRGAGA